MAEIRVEPWYIFQKDEFQGIDETKWRIYLDDLIVGIVFSTGNISITKPLKQHVRDAITEKVFEFFKEENPDAEFETHSVLEDEPKATTKTIKKEAK